MMKTIGIDIGGTYLRCAIFDESHKIIHRLKVENDQCLSPEDNLATFILFIKELDYEYRGIGVGSPGPISIREGKILNPPNIPMWHNFGIVKFLEQATGVKTTLNNDANVAGLAEARLGAGRGYESVFFITISTGVGGAYIYRGEIVGGANAAAAEIYNMIVGDDTYTRPGMNPGALELQCGGPALARKASEAYGCDVSAEELFTRFRDGDGKAEAIVHRAAEHAARGIANVACVVDPDIFILGGSVALKNPEFVELIRQYAGKYLIHPEALRIELAQFTDDAGLIGASLL